MTLPAGFSSTVAFHSRYAPLKEAKRHVDSILAGKRPAIVFIIGGGCNYLSAVLAEHYPRSLRISLQPCDDFLGHEVDIPKLNWYPSSSYSLRETIQRAIAGNRLAGGVAVIEWPPVVNQFQTETVRIRATLRDVLEEASSDAATSAYWSARWLFNSLRFVTSIRNTVRLAPGNSLIVVACAGPGLADLLPELLVNRSSMTLWALASAVPSLLRAGLIPDLVIATDPGFWNGAHLKAAFYNNIPIAMPPSTYVSCGTLRQLRIVPLYTGLSFERAAITAAGIGFENAKAAGSAAGTALSLALNLTEGPIALAGYDLAARGLMDHVQPYAFDILDQEAASRVAPAFSTRASRVFDCYPSSSGGWRRSRAFSTYAETIRVDEIDSNRVFRLGESCVETSLQRAVFKDIPIRKGMTHPGISLPQSLLDSSLSRDAASKVMLESLSESAFGQAATAVQHSEPIPYEAALYYKALAPRVSATLIAEAARGEATLDDVVLATAAANEAATRWLGCGSC